MDLYCFECAFISPYADPYVERGLCRKYGRKVDYADILEKQLQETIVEGPIRTRLYQAPLLHKEFAHPLLVVVILKANLCMQAQARVILFSSNLILANVSLVNSFGSRCQKVAGFGRIHASQPSFSSGPLNFPV